MADPRVILAPPARLVKICGLREPVHAEAAAVAGADLVGFVFAPSKRRVDPETARACVDAARGAAQRPLLAVGVFVNATADEMNETADRADLDLLQLHGDEAPAVGASLHRPAIKAFRPVPGATAIELNAAIAAFTGEPPGPLAYLIDGYQIGHYGGQGVRADWSLAAALARRWPIMLAGGLDPDNVATALRQVAPLAVDVSSGVETDGRKDAAKIAAFVRNARAGFAERQG